MNGYRHFLPRFGDAGRPMLATLLLSEHEIWDFAATLLEPREFAELGELTEAWLERHPENVNVEIVRFREFAEHVGELVAGFDRGSGLLRRVTGVTQTADHAVLLAERALFLAQRTPFLMRLHARIAAQAVVRDTALHLKDSIWNWVRLGGGLSYALIAVSGAAALWGGYRVLTRSRRSRSYRS